MAILGQTPLPLNLPHECTQLFTTTLSETISLLAVKKISLVVIDSDQVPELERAVLSLRACVNGGNVPLLIRGHQSQEPPAEIFEYGNVDFFPRDGSSHGLAARVRSFVELQQLRSHYRRRKKTEEKALEGERRFRQIVDSIPQGVWRTDPDGSADYFSARFAELVPCDTSNFLGWGWTEPIHPEDLPHLVEEWGRCRAAEIPVSVEFRLRTNEGQYLWFLSQGRPFFDEKGLLTKYYGTWTNIDEQKKASIELQQAKDAAERANQLKSAFLANMSHEIRTPLGAMLGFADLLRDPHLTFAERQNYVEILHRNGTQLGHVINDILDLSKIETGHLSFDFQNLSPHQVAAETLALFGLRAKEKGIELRLSSEPSAPAGIVSDPLRVRQILNNVVGNALKFTEKGAISVRVCGEEGDSEKRTAIFEIKDTGIGIAPEARKNLFQAFSQADNSITRKYGGTGLGLALSRSLARGLGGELELMESKPSEGSTFRLRIRGRTLSPSEQNALATPTSAKRAETGTELLLGLRVLVVEDAKDNQQLIERYLTKQGATVELVENGRDGVEAALRGAHDVVLMDIQMPVMDGYAAASALRSRGFGKPLLALSAHAMNDVRQRCLASGYNDYLPKPLDPTELIEKIVEYTRDASN